MSEVKFSPGPWYPVEFAGDIYLHEKPFYEGKNLLDKSQCAEAQANATLAAASPEMYEALRTFWILLNLFGQSIPQNI